MGLLENSEVRFLANLSFTQRKNNALWGYLILHSLRKVSNASVYNNNHVPRQLILYLYICNRNFSVHQSTYLEKIFEVLIDSYIETKVGTAKNFLNESLAHELKQNLQNLHQAKILQTAGIGNISFIQDKKVRGDLLHWLDRKSNNIHEIQFFALMDNFVQYLNETCYTSITDYEFHYTLYEAGSFYKRHLDQFKNDQSRQFSMIMYLNEDWQQKDGGELCIYHDEKIDKIAPTNGKCVFFKSSELHHEVLLTNKPRMSITGWLKVKKQF